MTFFSSHPDTLSSTLSAPTHLCPYHEGIIYIVSFCQERVKVFLVFGRAAFVPIFCGQEVFLQEDLPVWQGFTIPIKIQLYRPLIPYLQQNNPSSTTTRGNFPGWTNSC